MSEIALCISCPNPLVGEEKDACSACLQSCRNCGAEHSFADQRKGECLGDGIVADEDIIVCCGCGSHYDLTERTWNPENVLEMVMLND